MILDLVNRMMKYIIIIALISLVSTWAFGIQNVLITEATYNGITIKTVDFRAYTENLSNAWNTVALDFEAIKPTRTWDDSAAWNNWDGIFNNIAVVFDWIYFPINFILWIDRWIAWLLNLLLTLIGWNTMPSAYDPITGEATEYYSQLAYILNWIKLNFFIPYI